MNAVSTSVPSTAPQAGSGVAIQIEILTGIVVMNGIEVAVNGPQRLLLSALARCRHPVRREQLQALVWPDDGDERATNLFNVAVHRLRKRLGDGAIMQSALGYRFGDAVVVDLWQLEALAARLRGAPAPLLPLAEQWLPFYGRRACGCASATSAYEFLALLERRWWSAAREITDCIATSALDGGRPDIALALARATIAFDACDEGAREVAIRAHVARGDRCAAIREYRDYARALADELDLSPALSLRALLG